MSDALQFHVVSTCKTSQLTANHRRASEAESKGATGSPIFTEMDICEISVLHR